MADAFRQQRWLITLYPYPSRYYSTMSTISLDCFLQHICIYDVIWLSYQTMVTMCNIPTNYNMKVKFSQYRNNFIRNKKLLLTSWGFPLQLKIRKGMYWTELYGKLDQRNCNIFVSIKGFLWEIEPFSSAFGIDCVITIFCLERLLWTKSVNYKYVIRDRWFSCVLWTRSSDSKAFRNISELRNTNVFHFVILFCCVGSVDWYIILAIQK